MAEAFYATAVMNSFPALSTDTVKAIAELEARYVAERRALERQYLAPVVAVLEETLGKALGYRLPRSSDNQLLAFVDKDDLPHDGLHIWLRVNGERSFKPLAIIYRLQSQLVCLTVSGGDALDVFYHRPIDLAAIGSADPLQNLAQYLLALAEQQQQTALLTAGTAKNAQNAFRNMLLLPPPPAQQQAAIALLEKIGAVSDGTPSAEIAAQNAARANAQRIARLMQPRPPA